MPANKFNQTEHLTLLSSIPDNNFNSDKSILNDELTTNNVTKDKMDIPNNHFTSNDLWQSHNSLRDEQHRNEDRIARQLADSDSRLQKQLTESEQRWDKHLSESELRWDKRMTEMESRLINAINNVSSDVKHCESELRQDMRLLNQKIDKQDIKINAFASKKTMYIIGGSIAVLLIICTITAIHYISPTNLKELVEALTKIATALANLKKS